MQAGEYSIDVPLVRWLLLAQFPQWGSLSLFPIVSQGADHVIYRLGEDKVIPPGFRYNSTKITSMSFWS